MAKLNYGVTIRLTKNGRKLSAHRQRIHKLKSFSLFGGHIYTLGRAFQPNAAIQNFQTTQKKIGAQNAGVGIAYSIPSGSWVAFILPFRGKPLPSGFVEAHSSVCRLPIDSKAEGFAGWLLKKEQKQPPVVARFLKRTWEAYEEYVKQIVD